jgi:hypothetical protein
MGFKNKNAWATIHEFVGETILWIQLQILLAYCNVGYSVLKIYSTDKGNSQLKPKFKIEFPQGEQNRTRSKE